LQRHWIHVPGVTRNVFHAPYVSVTGGMKPVIHAGPETKSDEFAVAMSRDQIVIAEKIPDAVGETFCLDCLVLSDIAKSHDYRIARTGDDVRLGSNWPASVTEFTNEAIPQAIEVLCFGVVKRQIVKQAPCCQRNFR